jgi:hypothetical protein
LYLLIALRKYYIKETMMKKMAVITALFLALPVCFAHAQAGTILELSGTVELRNDGESAFVPAKAGDVVARNTIVSTGFKSTALIQVGSASVTVRPLTRLTLAEISEGRGTEEINVNLQAGRVKIDVKPPAGSKTSFAVQSPIATASVRGTSFEFDTRNVSVREGTVAFSGGRGAVMLVGAGSASRVHGESGRAADPIDVSAAALTPPAPSGPDAAAGWEKTALPPGAGPLPPSDNFSLTFDFQ